MRFVKAIDTESVAAFIADRLKPHLIENERVLWLVPGGSAISIASRVSQLLKNQYVSNLFVTLTDERYGPVGHDDSTWKQLMDSGFDLPGANLLPVLNNENRQATTQYYASCLREMLNDAEYKLGFFGIGSDGHTAGILPHSPAVMSKNYAADYDANYERITVTPLAILRLDEAVVYASGEAKWPIFDQLETDIELDKQPAQILKQIEELTIFNDHKGDPI